VADLSVRYFAALAELGTEYSRRFYEATIGITTPAPPVAADTPLVEPVPVVATQRVPLELHAPAGSVATGVFSLENRREAPCEVTFSVSPWSGSDGTLFRVPVVVDPQAVLLTKATKARKTAATSSASKASASTTAATGRSASKRRANSSSTRAGTASPSKRSSR
jgi:hypothetical protein